MGQLDIPEKKEPQLSDLDWIHLCTCLWGIFKILLIGKEGLGKWSCKQASKWHPVCAPVSRFLFWIPASLAFLADGQ